MSRENRRNYYRGLQVQPDAPAEVIKASYRTLMHKLRHHPDLGGDQWNAAIINDAYAVLSNIEKRAAYDKTKPHLFQNIASSSRIDESQEEPVHASETPNAPPQPPPVTPSEPTETPAPTAAGEAGCPFCGAANPSGGYRHLDNCNRCHATLSPVSAATSGSGRNARRIEHVSDMQLIVAWPAPERYLAKVIDLSPTGMQFVSRQLLRPNQRLKIESPTLSAIAVVSR